jgi:phosphoglycolate phosphatase
MGIKNIIVLVFNSMRSIDDIGKKNNQKVPLKHEIELLIFDLDGTLIDSQESIIAAIHGLQKKFGLEHTPSEKITSLIGVSSEYLVSGATGIPVESAEFADYHAAFRDLFWRETFVSTRLYPHTRMILDHFKNKSIALVTNRKKESARKTLEHFGIASYFNHIAGSDEIQCSKPAACPINRVRALFKADSARSLIVGDMDIDIFTGKNAGILTCAVRNGIGSLESILAADPDFLINDLSQLKEIFI